MKKTLLSFGLAGFLLFALGCSELQKALEPLPETPTRTRMQGVWKVTEAYNESDSSILDQIAFPVTAFWLQDANTMISTAGPMFMYVVYGGSKYTDIASKIDQVFNYVTLDFTAGEFFVSDGIVDTFAIEVKLEGLPGQGSLVTLLNLLGLNSQFLQTTVYHKFMNVSVEFNEGDDDHMTWTFDDYTHAAYNMKDANGNYVLWAGWPTTSFTRARFVLTKQTISLDSLVLQASALPRAR